MCCGLYFKGKTEKALQVLQDGLDECVRWGELDIQGLLMLEGAKLEAQRGKTDDSMATLKVLKIQNSDMYFLFVSVTESLQMDYISDNHLGFSSLLHYQCSR